MNVDAYQTVRRAVEDLRQVDQLSVHGGILRHFIEPKTDAQSNEFRVAGNFEGLVHVAMRILELAAADAEGAHVHFDETGVVDRCDMPLVVSVRHAPWG